MVKHCAGQLPGIFATLNVAAWPDPNADGSTTLPPEMALIAWAAIRYSLDTSTNCHAIPDPVAPP